MGALLPKPGGQPEDLMQTPITVPAGTVAYRSESAHSRRLYERASYVMPGGDTRHSIALTPYPVYARCGRGCRVTDVEGQERIDFLNNFTSLILGHSDPQVVAAVQARVASGTAFSMPTEADVELAELIASRVAYVDQIRFCNSGSEAILLAVKAARAFTGRRKIAKFEGAYHGIYDWVQVSDSPSADMWGQPASPSSIPDGGSPDSVGDDVVVLPWNNLDACRQLIAAHRAELAAVIVDPMPAGIGFIPPVSGLLEALREETLRHGILLIGDEVMSYRLAWKGAMHEFGIEPDLTAFGKIIGGGFPVGAVGGSRSVMSVFDKRGKCIVHHGGTFNGNPVTMTAGLATLRQMTPDMFDRLTNLFQYLCHSLERLLHDRAIPVQICGKSSLFLIHLTAEPLSDFRSLVGYSRKNPVSSGLSHAMLANGIVSGPRGLFGCLSTPMTTAEIDAYVEAVDRSVCA